MSASSERIGLGGPSQRLFEAPPVQAESKTNPGQEKEEKDPLVVRTSSVGSLLRVPRSQPSKHKFQSSLLNPRTASSKDQEFGYEKDRSKTTSDPSTVSLHKRTKRELPRVPLFNDNSKQESGEKSAGPLSSGFKVEFVTHSFPPLSATHKPQPLLPRGLQFSHFPRPPELSAVPSLPPPAFHPAPPLFAVQPRSPELAPFPELFKSNDAAPQTQTLVPLPDSTTFSSQTNYFASQPARKQPPPTPDRTVLQRTVNAKSADFLFWTDDEFSRYPEGPSKDAMRVNRDLSFVRNSTKYGLRLIGEGTFQRCFDIVGDDGFVFKAFSPVRIKGSQNAIRSFALAKEKQYNELVEAGIPVAKTTFLKGGLRQEKLPHMVTGIMSWDASSPVYVDGNTGKIIGLTKDQCSVLEQIKSILKKAWGAGIDIDALPGNFGYTFDVNGKPIVKLFDFREDRSDDEVGNPLAPYLDGPDQCLSQLSRGNAVIRSYLDPRSFDPRS